MNMRSFGVTSKSCSCAGTLPVSGRSEWNCMLFALSAFTRSAEMVPGGSACARAGLSGSEASAPALAAAVRNCRRRESLLLAIRISSPGHFAAEYAIGVQSVADDEWQHDAGADQHEHQRARVRGRLPDRHAIDDHVRE